MKYLLALICLAGILSVSGQTVPANRQPANVSANQLMHSLLPVPQECSTTGKMIALHALMIEEDPTQHNAVTTESLASVLKEKHLLVAHSGGSQQPAALPIHLNISTGSVKIGQTPARDREAIERQAYQLKISASEVSILANTEQGLYYGAQTLLQLLELQSKNFALPEGEITDWPRLDVRMIYWDDAHHLEKPEVLKEIILQASRYKINAFSIKLEGHFQFKTAPAIVEPYALSADQYRELSEFARAHFVDLVPYLDAPAHVAFILKHPEYARLRAFPQSNYELSVVNPGTDSLLFGLFDELIAANPGGKYILLSTDEAYYVGKAADDQEAAAKLGSRGKLLTQFTGRIADSLHARGRDVIFWGEYPLQPSDIPTLPGHLINGEYDSATSSLYRKDGMRQCIYTYTQGEEPLFPSYAPMSSGDTAKDAEKDRTTGRVDGMRRTITGALKDQPDFLGTIIAGWADAGLHPETFWLGYATGAAMGWNASQCDPDDLSNRFYKTFYGGGAAHMDLVYRLLSRQAQFYDQSWDWGPSSLRKPIFGNHATIYSTPEPALDQTLPALPVPDEKSGSIANSWRKENSRRIDQSRIFLKENAQLLRLLEDNMKLAPRQRYNLEVMHSVARLCRQNLSMIIGLAAIDSLLNKAAATYAANPRTSVRLWDAALDTALAIRERRNQVLAGVVNTWYKQWFPRVANANGRSFLHAVDDVKDHRPDRTIDMTYLIYRNLHFPFDQWYDAMTAFRNQAAKKMGQPRRTDPLNWTQTPKESE